MTIKPMNERSYQAQEIELRAIQIIDLASMLGTQAYEDGSSFDLLGAFIEHLLEDGKKHPSVAAIAASVRVDVDEENDDIDVSEAGYSLEAGGYFGFAVQFGTPVRNYRTESSWWSGWGRYYTRWVYAETFEDAWAMGVAWAEESAREDLEKFTAEKNGGAA